ncbi:hypothetical protein Kuura_018 [Caulobacter phage Kuura]|nr:hypothetical protein Kuura_018 [Caulobacter phage Kuura]
MANRPELECLVYVAPSAITAKHFEGVKKIVEHSVDPITLREAAVALREGLVALWEVKGTDDPAIVCTRVIRPDNANVLWLDGLAGNGIISNAKAIMRDLLLIAREYECSRVGTATRREAWAAMSDKFGFTQVSATYSMEVDP